MKDGPGGMMEAWQQMGGVSLGEKDRTVMGGGRGGGPGREEERA